MSKIDWQVSREREQGRRAERRRGVVAGVALLGILVWGMAMLMVLGG